MRDKARVAYEKKLAKIVGERIAALRAERGWNQVDLEAATESVVVRSTIGNFESGARLPSFYALSRIADALGVPLAYLIVDPKASEAERAAFAMLRGTRTQARAVLSLVAESAPDVPYDGKRQK